MKTHSLLPVVAAAVLGSQTLVQASAMPPLHKPAPTAKPASIHKPLKERVVTEANNGAKITLVPGEVLVVKLEENPSTGYSWAVVQMPEMPVRLVSQAYIRTNSNPRIVGAPGQRVLRFVPTGKTSFSRGAFLKLVYLRPFAKGLEGTKLWEVNVTVPGVGK